MAFTIDDEFETLLKKLLAHTTQKDANGDPTNEADNNARKVCEMLIKYKETGRPGMMATPEAEPNSPRKSVDPRDSLYAPNVLKKLQWAEFLFVHRLEEVDASEERLWPTECVKCGQPAGDEMVLRLVRGQWIPGRRLGGGWTHRQCAQFWVDIRTNAPKPDVDSE